jgi:hypothetical protein
MVVNISKIKKKEEKTNFASRPAKDKVYIFFDSKIANCLVIGILFTYTFVTSYSNNR